MSETNRRGLTIFAVLIVFAVIVCGWLPFSFLPSQHVAPGIPVIQVPGEALIYHWKPLGIDLGEDFNLLNTMVALFIVDIIVILIAVLTWRSTKGWRNQIPGRFQAAMELIVDGIYSLCKSIGGVATAQQVFPLVASIFLFLLVANWMSVVPGVESVGLFHCAYAEKNGYAGTKISDGLFQLNNAKPLNSGYGVNIEDHLACIQDTGIGHLHGHNLELAEKAGLVHVNEEGEVHLPVPANPGDPELLAKIAVDAEGNPLVDAQGNPTNEPVYKYHLTPFIRPAATDLNLTIGLALISFITIQIYGFRSQGLNYLQKFFPIRSLGNLSKKPLGAIDMIVGPLELVSELSKIVSLSFRLFGNIFAGAILLAVMLFLVGSGLPVIFYALELIVGLAQALVFAVLTLVFVSQAMQSHGDHDDEHEHAEEHH